MSKNVSDSQATDRALEDYTRLLRKDYLTRHGVEKSADVDHIVLPMGMDEQTAAKELMKIYEYMSSKATETLEFVGHPDDMLWCFMGALREKFGEVISKETRMWAWAIPATNQTVTVGYGKTESLPYGKVEIPGVNIQLVVEVEKNPKNIMESKLTVVFTFTRLFEQLVQSIKDLTLKKLLEDSLFKGKAVDSSMNFLNPEELDHIKPVYSASVAHLLNNHLFGVIRWPDIARKRGAIQRKILLYGPYGTGKTMTALAAAKMAIDNGWSFILVKPGHSIKDALAFAKRYQKSIVFFEDLDREASAGAASVQDILIAVDGALGKKDEVVVIMTTNHLDEIDQGMLRPGRIDLALQLNQLDEPGKLALIRQTAGEHLKDLEPTPDQLARLAVSCEGYPPAYLVEGTRRATLSAGMENGQIDAKVDWDDIIAWMSSLQAQYEMMTSHRRPKVPTLDAAFRQAMSAVSVEVVSDKIDEFKDELNPRVLKDGGG
jgi:hypothetical protein